MTTFLKTMLLLTLKSKKTNFYVYVYPWPEFSNPESRIEKVPDPHQRTEVFLSPEIVTKLSKIWSGDVHPGYRIQGSKKHRIPSPQRRW